MSSHQPLVSCICVTHHSVEFLKRAIRCFQEQTYQNKELVISFTSNNKDAIALLEELKDERIKPLPIPENTKFTLGEKRNWAIDHSTGFYICVWDDDDWYNSRRLEFQVKSLEGNPFKSTVLSSVILFDSNTNEAYRSATRWAWEQTLLCERAVFDTSSLRYPALDRGEDSVLIYNLKKSCLLLTTHNPALYIYVYHGQNTWHRQHWDENFIRWATKLTVPQSAAVHKILYDDTVDYALVRSLTLELSPAPKE
jgi:glycosyltransferase involved in cell wall biosynthesis